jgi:hypothetical protein
MFDYIKRLRSHPGVPVAIYFQLVGFIFGITSQTGDKLDRTLFCVGVMSLIWIPVLWTNRK